MPLRRGSASLRTPRARRNVSNGPFRCARPGGRSPASVMLTVVMGKAEEDRRRDELLASIVRETIVRIESAALPLPVRLDAEAERQMRAILDEAADAIEGPDDPGAADGLALSYDASSPQLQTGRIRASQR